MVIKVTNLPSPGDELAKAMARLFKPKDHTPTTPTPRLDFFMDTERQCCDSIAPHRLMLKFAFDRAMAMAKLKKQT